MAADKRGAAWLATAALLVSLLYAPAALAQDEVEGDADVLAAQAELRPIISDVPTEQPLAPLSEGSAIDAAALTSVVDEGWGDDVLGAANSRALTIRDVETGESLYDSRASQELTPASTTKILTAAAVMTEFEPAETLQTSVMFSEDSGSSADSDTDAATATSAPGGTVTIVAGGDMLLSSGTGSPDNVVGRAGVADLAQQTASALEMRGVNGPITVTLDTSYAEGDDVAPGWTEYWVDNGFAGRITMLGLAADRALPFEPSTPDPAMEVADVLAQALGDEGVNVASGDIRRAPAAEAGGPIAMVESAPLAEVLGVGLRTSDNAMLEQLARQAALRAGESADQDAVNAWVVGQVENAYGVDVTGVDLADTSGLSDGSTIPVRVLGDLLVEGASGDQPAFESILDELPIAAFNGTLFDRFLTDAAAQGRGVVRAKTGSLPEVTALAGYIVTDDGRLLAFALTANDVGIGTEFLNARAQIDAVLADVANCGC